MLQDMWQFNNDGGVKTALTWALARCAHPELHAHFVREFVSQPESAAVVQELGHKLAQQGRFDVLDHLLQEGIITTDNTTDTTLLISINNGALQGDRAETVEWLLSHGLMLDDIRRRVMPCHGKLVTYFAQLDEARAEAEAAAE
jgi:hypothetical protein